MKPFEGVLLETEAVEVEEAVETVEAVTEDVGREELN